MKKETILSLHFLRYIKIFSIIFNILNFKNLRFFTVILFLLLGQLVVKTELAAQTLNSEITFELQNQSLSSGLDKLARVSKLRVSYTIPQVSKYTKITVEKGSRTVAATLDLLLSKTNLTYTLKGNNVVIIEKNDRTADISPEQNRQPGVITGNVTKADGEVLVGVTILVKETDGKGTITDSKGNFSLALTGSEETLVFSQVGLKKQEVNVNGRSRVNVKMEDESYALEQVVVTGIFNKKLAAYTGAAVTVTAKELEMSGTRNLITSLRNIDPSFNILDNNLYGSDPNRTPEIQIRGNSSVPNISELKDETSVGLNTPLVIIDGFQSTLQRLIDMNQYEIESITILKDASATAIYGSRGANGVVVVKTKAPVEGKLRITYNGRVNFEAPDLTGYNLLGAREKLELEYKTGLYNNARAESDLPLKKYYNYLLNEVNSGVSTDWLALPLQLGLGQKHNLRLEGGNEQFRYSASAQLNNVNGVMKGSARNNFNGTIKLSYDFKNITFANELAVGFTNTAESPYGSFGEYALMNPYWRPYDKNGDINKYLGNPGTTDYVGIWSTLPTNPMYNSTINTFDKQNNNLITNTTSVDWNIFKDLNLVAKLGLSKGMNQRDRFRPADHTEFSNYSTDDILRKGDYLYITGNKFSYDGSVRLFYSKQINKHSFNYGLDYNIFETSNSSYSFLSEGFSNENFDFPSMALQYAKNGKPSGDESLVRSIGLTTNLIYSYDNRYFTDLSFREDASSQFGSEKRFAPFWSAGIGWNLHNEKFISNLEFVDHLKIRGSAGTSGSQNFNAYQALSTYKYYTDDRYYSWMGAYLQGLGNKNLTWQQKENYNLGFETQLFKQRILLAVDVYTSRTNNLVSSIDLAPSNGFSSYVENVGRMKNDGFEAKVTTYLYKNQAKRISWNITAAIFQNRNKVLEISQALKDAQQKIIEGGGSIPTKLYLEGYSSNTIWVIPSLGIDPSTGKEVFLDKNDQPTYTWSSKNIRACGNTEPKLQGSIGSLFRYKNFTANVSFRFLYGGQAYNQTLINKVENANYKYNVDARVYTGRWQYPGDKAIFKSLNITSATQMTSRFVQNENSLTGQNINLQYNIMSRKLINALGLNVITLSAGVDDFFYLSSIKRERGLSYPFARNISFGVTGIF